MKWQDLVPPIVLNLARRYLRNYGYRGSYADWASADRAAGGYDSQEILAAAAASARRVRDGESAGERDGQVLARPEPVWPFVAACQQAAIAGQQPVRVLDFGGGLGGSYYQHRALLQGIDVHWTVVEQEHYVALGQAEFSTAALTFNHDLAATLVADAPDVALLSSVLQYLPEPLAALDQIAAAQPGWIVLDRTPCTRTDAAELTVQTAHPSVYRGSYPAWLLDPRAIEATLVARRYRCVSEFQPIDHDYRADYRGFVYRLDQP